jgi:hypothetical protein
MLGHCVAERRLMSANRLRPQTTFSLTIQASLTRRFPSFGD